MSTIIYPSPIFGPVHSRRLGISLGINLLPADGKVCSFDCIYCECGFNEDHRPTLPLPTRELVAERLEAKLKEMNAEGQLPDVLTFAGNGEPTCHPHFAEIIDDTIRLRDQYCPKAKVSVLSNATMAGRPNVIAALKQVDNNILKLDSAVARTMRQINRPTSANVLPQGIIEDLKAFGGKCIVQTMMVRGEHDGQIVDNTTDAEIDALINAYLAIQPREIMLYTIDRKTPEEKLVKVPAEDLKRIARRIEAETGITVQVSC